MQTNVPQAFYKLGANYYQGSTTDILSEDEWIALGTRGLSKDEKATLRNFFYEILSRNLPDVELEQIWVKADSDYFIYGPNGVRKFFERLHSLLKE